MIREVFSLGVALDMARRELRGGLSGFRIFIACLALGVAAIASVQSISSSVLQGLREDGRGILGGDISLQLLYRGLSRDQREYVDSTSEEVTQYIEMRTMARSAQSDRSTLIELKGVDDLYPLFGRMELQQGAGFRGLLDKRNDRWGALVEPSIMQRLGVRQGELIRIGDIAFEVRGVNRIEWVAVVSSGLDRGSWLA